MDHESGDGPGLPPAQRAESVAAVAEGIAHDLMSVLASISMSLELLSPRLGPEDAWLAEALAEGVARGRDGVRQIYWLASARPGRPVHYDPLHLVRDARRLLAQGFPHIEVSIEYAPETGLVLGEPELLRQLIVTAAATACSRAGARGRLTLRARRLAAEAPSAPAEGSGARVRIEVESAGQEALPAAEGADWREGAMMAAVLRAFAAQGGTVEVAEGAPGTLAVRLEMPVALPPKGADR